MPNANVTIYLTDEEYVNYLQHKKDINKKAREIIKKEISKIK